MVQKFKTLADAIALAEYAHRNQTDKAGLPYIEHPRRVMQKVQAQGGLPYVQIAAILHDVTEDTAFSTDILRSLGFSEAALQIVRLVDRDWSENQWREARERHLTSDSPDEYYYKAIAEHPGAKMVKLADIEDNLSPWRQAYLEPATQVRLKAKYGRALEILTPSLNSVTGTWSTTSKTVWE